MIFGVRYNRLLCVSLYELYLSNTASKDTLYLFAHFEFLVLGDHVEHYIG